MKRVAVTHIAGMIVQIKESFDASCGTGNSLEASPGSATGVTSGNFDQTANFSNTNAGYGSTVVGTSGNRAGSTLWALIDGGNTGGAAFSIYGNGNINNANGVFAAYSDVKLKENIVDANSQWDDIRQLRVRNYNFKPETNNSTHKQIGVIAQEIEDISPGLVNTVPDRDEDGNDLGTVTKSVNYSVLYMKAVKALQEAMERIETLEARLAAAGIE